MVKIVSAVVGLAAATLLPVYLATRSLWWLLLGVVVWPFTLGMGYLMWMEWRYDYAD